MKKIHLRKTKDYYIDRVRFDEELYEKLDKLATENQVTMQTIIEEMLINFIDEVIIE